MGRVGRHSVLAGKGCASWSLLPYRRTSRFDCKIHDLGTEHLEEKSKNALGRKAKSSHVVFGRPIHEDEFEIDRMTHELKSEAGDLGI